MANAERWASKKRKNNQNNLSLYTLLYTAAAEMREGFSFVWRQI